MIRRLITIGFVAVLVVAVLPINRTSAQEPPEYLRYCDRSNDPALIESLNLTTPQLDEIDQTLEPFENGNLTFLEGITLAEEMVNAWATITLPDCLLPLKKDVDDALNSLLFAMLYGQIENPAKSTQFLEFSNGLRAEIRTNIAAAVDYLNTPAETAAEETTTTETDENGLRSSETLNPLLNDFLLNNGVSVLDNAGIQVFPGNTLILIQLNRFSAEYDLPNVLYTLDQLGALIKEWPETNEITNIVVETYDGSERVLVVTSTGEAFRNYYINGTLTKEEFEAQLVQQ